MHYMSFNHRSHFLIVKNTTENMQSWLFTNQKTIYSYDLNNGELYTKVWVELGKSLHFCHLNFYNSLLSFAWCTNNGQKNTWQCNLTVALIRGRNSTKNSSFPICMVSSSSGRVMVRSSPPPRNRTRRSCCQQLPVTSWDTISTVTFPFRDPCHQKNFCVRTGSWEFICKHWATF